MWSPNLTDWPGRTKQRRKQSLMGSALIRWMVFKRSKRESGRILQQIASAASLLSPLFNHDDA